MYKKKEVVCYTKFIQRDMDATALGFDMYQTPFSKDPVVLECGFTVEHLETGICGSGDYFESNHTSAAYNVVDMEAYTIALIAKREQVPFLCLKYISDGANGSAGNDWQSTLHKAAVHLKKEIKRLSK